MLAMMNNRNNIGGVNTCQQKPQQPSIVQNPSNNSNANNQHSNEIYSNYSVKQTTTTTSSGSETDVSTSTENLSPEEHYVLKNSQRQEPQGEETYFNNDCLASPLNTNTLIIHGNDSSLHQQPGAINNQNSIYSYMSPAPSYFFGGATKRTAVAGTFTSLNNKDAAGAAVMMNKTQSDSKVAAAATTTGDAMPYHNARALLEQHHQQQQQQQQATPPVPPPTIMLNDKNEVINLKNNNLISLIDNDSHYSNLNLLKYSMNLAAQTASQAPPGHPLFSINNQLPDSVINIQSCNDNCNKRSTTNNNSQQQQSAMNLQQPMLNDYLNSLKKNDSLMLKNFNVASLDLPPQLAPATATSAAAAVVDFEKPAWNGLQIQNANSKSLERFSISRSHPDLSKFSDEDINGNNNHQMQHPSSSIIAMPLNMGQRQRHNTIEILLIENSQLRTELDFCYKKLQKFEKVESEIQKIYQSYDELMKSSEKKEKFEREARFKLELEVKKLQKQNKCLQERLDSTVTKKMNFDESDLEKELNKRAALISYLLAKNKELINYKERQEIELEAQRLTLQEQRNHIEILDTALINAQNNIMTLENELRKKQGWEEKALFLEKALSNLQSTNERRLQMEKRIRTYLEKELEKFKGVKSAPDAQQQPVVNNQDPDKRQRDDVETMKAAIVCYEKKIIDLEAEVSKWEQKYLEENTLRSIEVCAASAPKDAKIAALERTSQESEKLIAEARTERLKHMDEIHVANKKCAELESKLKDSNFKLAEKEAIIKILQKHSDDKDAVLQKTLRFTTASAAAANSSRHTRSASTMGLVASTNPAAKTAHHYSNTEVLPNTIDYHQAMLEATTESGGDTSSCTGVHFTAEQETKLNEEEPASTSNNSKDSIINALRNEKERYPNHYNNWRL